MDRGIIRWRIRGPVALGRFAPCWRELAKVGGDGLLRFRFGGMPEIMEVIWRMYDSSDGGWYHTESS